jgi:pyruvate kinase
LHDERDSREPESDNEVPPDLLVARGEGHEVASPTLSRESSNEVPPEFLREHHSDEEYPGFGVMA